MSTKRLTIFDTTLRDGEQAPGFSLRTDEKLTMARQLAALGVDMIEAGFPIASEADAEAVRLVATHVRRAGRSPVWPAVTPADIDRAGWALEPAPRRRIHIFIATSDLHLERKLRISREACLDAAVAAVHRARRYTDDVQFSAEDATRSDLDFLCRVVEAVISAGCTTINLPDTVGYSTPDEIGDVLPDDPRARAERRHADVQHALPRRPRACGGEHAWRPSPRGARQVECTINGIGERAGNASLEEIVMATRVRSDRLPFETRHRDARALSRPASC